MVQVAGKYTLDKNENYETYLKVAGLPEEKIAKAIMPGFTTEISVDGKTYTMKNNPGIDVTFTLDEEFDEPVPVPIKVKSVAKLEGDSIVINSKADDGRTGVRSFEFNDKGFTLVMTANNITAKRYFVRN